MIKTEIEPTPGRWEIQSHETIDEVISKEFNITICTVWGKSPSKNFTCKEQAVANLKVILAAGRMLKLLKKVRANLILNEYEQKSMLVEEIDALLADTIHYKEKPKTPIHHDYYERQGKG